MARNTGRSSGAKDPTPVNSITHDEKRTNIPTADTVDFHDSPLLEEVRQVRYGRDESLDPQLVWRGKYPPADEDEGCDDLVSDAPPIYIQEKIDPRVLIENLRRTAERPEMEPELTLFDSFDGLDDLQQIEFYKHEANWSNRMILGDSLQVMASLAEREKLRGKVQMVYIDPPYGIKFGSNWQASARNRNVKDGKMADAVREPEQIKAFRDTWELGINSYLSYLRDRLVAAKNLLTNSGSCFVQIGDENVHLVRALMDEVFGSDNFCALINYKTTTGAGSPGITTEVLAGVSDYLIWYAKDRSKLKYRALYFERDVKGDANYRYIDDGGSIRTITRDEAQEVDRLYRSGARILRQNPLTSQTAGATTIFPVDLDGKTYRPNKGGWKTNASGMDKLRHAGRLMPSGNTLGFVRYFADFPYQIYSNSWDDTRQSGYGDAKTYVVQTASKVITRCMLLTTDPGDLGRV